MYENAEAELTRIIALSESCPELYRAKAFEILLLGFVNSLAVRAFRVGAPQNPEVPPAGHPDAEQAVQDVLDVSVPPEVETRLLSLAKRRGVPADALSHRFDFSSDPFAFAPLTVSGAGISDRLMNVALLVCVRSYLATGRWQGDWAEIKAMCVLHHCYDVEHFAAVLKRAKGDIFKSVDAGKSVELSVAGIEQAERLLAAMSRNDDAAE